MRKSIKHFLSFVILLYPLSSLTGQSARIVDVTQQWTNTGIQLSDSQGVTIYAQGYATWSNSGYNSDLLYWFTPAGIGGTYVGLNQNFPCPTCPGYSLIAKIGDNGEIRYIGTFGVIGSLTGGTLYLGINDDIASDNYGAFIALIFPWEGLPTSVVENETLNYSFNLSQNYPNPFNPTTTIQYSVQNADNVIIKIYDSLGEQIKILVNETKVPGEHTAVWDGKDDGGKIVSSGAYFYQIQVGDYVQAKKMILLK